MDSLFSSVLTTSTTTMDFSFSGFLLCTAVSLILGLATAWIYRYRGHYPKNFLMTLALLPAIVQLVITIVNGNLGVGMAVLGAFSLIRFRSTPGSARDIAAIFFSMAIGLATGMGYIAIACVFVVIVGGMTLLYSRLDFGESRHVERQLRITIPEDLDYEDMFDDLFESATTNAHLVSARTTNMGSLFQLRYVVTLRQGVSEKAFLDEIRRRNGNLEVAFGHELFTREESL